MARLLPFIALAAACSAFDRGDDAQPSTTDAGSIDAAPVTKADAAGDDARAEEAGTELPQDASSLADAPINNDGVLVQLATYTSPQAGTISNYAYSKHTEPGHMLMMIVAGRFAASSHQPASVSVAGTAWAMVGSSSYLPLSAWIAPNDGTSISAVQLDWGAAAPEEQIVVITEWTADSTPTLTKIGSANDAMSIDPPEVYGSGSFARSLIVDLAAVDVPAGIASGPLNGFAEILSPGPVGNIALLAAFRVVAGTATVASNWGYTTKHNYDALALAFDISR